LATDRQTNKQTDGQHRCTKLLSLSRAAALQTDNNKYITHVGSHFSLSSTARPKLFVISRILAESLLVYAIVRLIRISAEFFLQPSVFFRLQIGDLAR